MTVIFQFLNVDKRIMEYVAVTNVPSTSLFLFLANQRRFEGILNGVYAALERDFGSTHYLFYGVYDQSRSCRKLLCSFDFNGLGEASSTD